MSLHGPAGWNTSKVLLVYCVTTRHHGNTGWLALISSSCSTFLTCLEVVGIRVWLPCQAHSGVVETNQDQTMTSNETQQVPLKITTTTTSPVQAPFFQPHL